jgi:hypothetical protein
MQKLNPSPRIAAGIKQSEISKMSIMVNTEQNYDTFFVPPLKVQSIFN